MSKMIFDISLQYIIQNIMYVILQKYAKVPMLHFIPRIEHTYCIAE